MRHDIPAKQVITPTGSPSSRDGFATALREHGVIGIVAFLAIVLSGNVVLENRVVLPVGATLALLWAWLSRTPWRDLGLVRPGSWITAINVGIIFGIALKLLMKVVVMPLLGAPSVNQWFQFLVGNRAMIPTAIWAMFVAGFGEEMIFRGFFFERLRKVFGKSRSTEIAIVVVTSLWFGIGHYNMQGLAGVHRLPFLGSFLE